MTTVTVVRLKESDEFFQLSKDSFFSVCFKTLNCQKSRNNDEKWIFHLRRDELMWWDVNVFEELKSEHEPPNDGSERRVCKNVNMRKISRCGDKGRLRSQSFCLCQECEMGGWCWAREERVDGSFQPWRKYSRIIKAIYLRYRNVYSW